MKGLFIHFRHYAIVGSCCLLLSACSVVSEKREVSQVKAPPASPVAAKDRPVKTEQVAPALKLKSKPCICPTVSSEMPIIGEAEWVTIFPEGIRQRARIDTGATTTSIGVSQMERFERDGKPWVKFTVALRDGSKQFQLSKPIIRTISIKRHNAESVKRPAVKLLLGLGSEKHEVEVTLADRDKFTYPVLVGRNLLSGNYLVDVEKKYSASVY